MCLGDVQEGDPQPNTHPHARQDLGEAGGENDVPVHLPAGCPGGEDTRQVLLVDVPRRPPRRDEDLEEEDEGNHRYLGGAPCAEDEEEEEDQRHLRDWVGDVDHRRDEPVDGPLATDEEAEWHRNGKSNEHRQDKSPSAGEKVPLQLGRVLHHLGEGIKWPGKKGGTGDRVHDEACHLPQQEEDGDTHDVGDHPFQRSSSSRSLWTVPAKASLCR